MGQDMTLYFTSPLLTTKIVLTSILWITCSFNETRQKSLVSYAKVDYKLNCRIYLGKCQLKAVISYVLLGKKCSDSRLTQNLQNTNIQKRGSSMSGAILIFRFVSVLFQCFEKQLIGVEH